MLYQTWTIRLGFGAAMLLGLLWASVQTTSIAAPAPVLVGNKCILCSSVGANHVPRICTSCDNKFRSKCILCNSFGASQVPRICTSCNNKFSNRCILCNSFGANQVPRICNSCNNKY
jgi:xanthosine utilization system XapX-like protein